MLEKQEKEEQLSLGVKVSFFTTIQNNIARFKREIGISPLFVLLKSMLFWLNGGIVLGILLVIRSYGDIIPVGRAVLLNQGYVSDLPLFIERSVLPLLHYDVLVFVVPVFHIVYLVCTLLLIAKGRFGILQYALLFEVLILLVVGKALLSPLILLGW